MAKYIDFGDKAAEDFGKKMSKVMRQLEKRVTDIVAGTVSQAELFDLAAIQNSLPAMQSALKDAGYNELYQSHVAKYPQVLSEVKGAFKGSKLPPPEFTTPAKETFGLIAKADLQAFDAIGTKAINDLHLAIFRNVAAKQPFSTVVETIRAGTTGIDGKGSPLSNHAYTHANTAIQSFHGEVIREAGESIGAEEWEVVGPNDAVTRDVCEAALSEPVRTQEEWISADYWGGSPGGWNCRHQLFPYFGE